MADRDRLADNSRGADPSFEATGKFVKIYETFSDLTEVFRVGGGSRGPVAMATLFFIS